MSAASGVRLACAADLAAILDLERATAEAPHWPEAAYRDYLAAPAGAIQRKALWVAINGSVQGFAAVTVTVHQAELESIAVAESVQRSGFGSDLLGAVCAWARQNGARSLLLEVRSSNRGAQDFYRARGFTSEGIRPRYYDRPADDAVLMSLDLAGHGTVER